MLIVSTPLLIVPIVFFLNSSWVGVEIETIALVVTAFFALGHHLPGMIRAYGDHDLFQRFRLRFILAPIALVALSFPLYRYHYNVFLLTLYFWGCWHGLMQLYGFVRIYDAKVGSTAALTANLDWLICLSWFPTALLFSEKRTADFLGFWYSFGGPFIPPSTIETARHIALSSSIAVLIGFLANHIIQSFGSKPPNPIKLWMLASGIGFWWFAFVYLQFSALSVTLFEITHDIQYIAITWLYNCRRVSSTDTLDGFMKLVFRRGMAFLYLGLIAAYGAIGLIPSLVQDGSVFAFVNAFILISTILHYYYDGFIWKVREKTTQSGLGVCERSASPRTPRMSRSGIVHFLKWSPVIVFIGWLFFTDLTEISLPQSVKESLMRQYERQLSIGTPLPSSPDQQSWLYGRFSQVQSIAMACPADQDSQMSAAIMLANFGRIKEATELLEKSQERRPLPADGQQLLGEIHLARGNLDQAIDCFEEALSLSRKNKEKVNANLKLAEVYLIRNEPDLARARIQDAIKINPQADATIGTLQKANAFSSPR